MKTDEKLSIFRKKKFDDPPNWSMGRRDCSSNAVSIFGYSVLFSDSNCPWAVSYTHLVKTVVTNLMMTALEL